MQQSLMQIYCPILTHHSGPVSSVRCRPQSLRESDSALLRLPHPMTHPALRLPLTALPLRPGTDGLFGELSPKKDGKRSSHATTI